MPEDGSDRPAKGRLLVAILGRSVLALGGVGDDDRACRQAAGAPTPPSAWAAPCATLRR